jgi:hypothetical protein
MTVRLGREEVEVSQKKEALMGYGDRGVIKASQGTK